MSKIIQVKEDVFAVPFFRKGAFGGIDARQPNTGCRKFFDRGITR